MNPAIAAGCRLKRVDRGSQVNKHMPYMNFRALFMGVLILNGIAATGLAAPVIDPIANVTIPAGKSLILPITATSANGLPLTYTITSSTNAVAVVMHTNNPFWQLTVAQAAAANTPGAYQTPFRGGLVSVTNVGTMTFMLFPEYAPHTINVFQGLTTSGFYNSNTIFHRIIPGEAIQGGDPNTNGTGGLIFQYDDEFNPQAIFSGNGQLALANSGKNTDGSQFFVSVGPQRQWDFGYTLFGQLVRGFPVLTNIDDTPIDTNSRPLADEIIQTASYVTNTTDTMITLTATNVSGINATITVIASDGAGGFATNIFTATTATDSSSNNNAFINTQIGITNLVAPLNATLTNLISATELDGDSLYWYLFIPYGSPDNASSGLYYSSNSYLRTLTYNLTNTNGLIRFLITPNSNYAGPISIYFDVSYANTTEYEEAQWSLYEAYGYDLPAFDEQLYTFVFGDTPIHGQSNTVTALASVPFTNLVLATFTNGVPKSVYTNFTAYVNWGDDTTNTVTVTENATGEKAVLGGHTYLWPGTYPVYVQVQSGIGASSTILSCVNVTNPPAPVTNLFTVAVTGQGTVAPDYTSAPLAVGDSYFITATPASTWLLASWTDENGFVLGTGTNLTFTMSPNFALTANFVLIQNPSLKIIAPTNSQVITNLYTSPATVTGTASNNATVASVWFQVNDGGWQEATGTTNWTASFAPAYGVSNVFQAYAVNNYGYISPTNTMVVKYLAGGILTLATNGLGSIAPNLNNALLPFGTNYTLTATPASGFTFVNWTGTFSTNKAALIFTMTNSPVLTATFADATAPTVAITNVTGGQQVTTNILTVLGTAHDNWQVANVLYSLNGAGWTNATTINTWTNWAASVVLSGGTNTFAAYAVDPNGEASLTNKVSFQNVVTNLLTVRSVGLGTISPNYSNALLQIGRNYTMTATPATGFAVTNWTLSTNFTGGTVTNNATVQFMMASNLTLQVTFAETTKPTLTITMPTAAQHLTNALPTIAGTTADNWGVAGVWYKVNSGAWTAPTTTNVWTNWTTTAEMASGSNIISAYAQNLGGNFSATNTIDVLSSNAFLLQLSFLTTKPLATNGLNLGLLVSTGLVGHVQFSTNLTSWNTLTNFVGTNSTLHLLDPAATNSGKRYYRAVIP
jgi:cyclophilin family peptidyl-prolyl cis-trans isomerase